MSNFQMEPICKRMHLPHRQLSHLIACCVMGSIVVNGQEAAVLLKRMQTALGGPRMLKVKDIDWEVKARVLDGAGNDAGFVKRRVRVVLPHQFRKDQDMHVSKDHVLHTRFYFDGKVGWGTFADMAKQKDTPVVSLEGSALNMVRREVRGFWFNLWQAQDFDVSVCASNTLRFVDKTDQSQVTELEVDADSGLPIRSGDLCKGAAAGAKGNQTRITEWLLIDGIKLPGRILNYRDGRIVADIETITAKVDTHLTASDLAQPSNLQ